jgi:biotin-(acetyl-CoA carboxylase) ligase
MVAVGSEEWRKVGGILIESGGGEALVAGVGINVYQRAPDLPSGATSLAIAGCPLPEIEEFAADVAFALLERVARLAAGEALADDYKARLINLGRYVQVWGTDGCDASQERAAVAGVAIDVEHDGALVIRESSGRRRTVRAGDVTLRQPESSDTP